MANQVSGLAGYNFYIQNSDGTYTKANTTPVADGAPFTFSNLSADTDYDGDLFWTSVDNAGNESAKVAFTTGAQTLNPTPDEVLMNATKTAAIDAIVAECIAAGAGPGVTIAIVSPDGYYNQSYGSGTAVGDFYRVASQTKTFTGTAVLMAVDKGLISLSDNLSKYLSGYAVDPTIQQMMMMQSGIYDYELAAGGSLFGFGLIPISLGEAFNLNPAMAYTVPQIMAIIQAGGAMFTPGSAYYYTNSNHYVLATILETVDPAQRSIDQIIQQDILDPLGLVNTYFELGTGTPNTPYAAGLADNPIEAELGVVTVEDVSNQNTAFIWAAGAIVSMISDMIKWGQELRDGTLLSSEMHQLRMSTFTQQPNAGTAQYGLNNEGPPTFGYGLAQIQVGSWFGHDGWWLGWDSCTMFNPINGAVISVYENFATSTPHTLASLTTIWYEIAQYLYPGSAFYPGWGQTESGGASCVLPGVSASMVASQYIPSDVAMPATMPAVFEQVV